MQVTGTSDQAADYPACDCTDLGDYSLRSQNPMITVGLAGGLLRPRTRDKERDAWNKIADSVRGVGGRVGRDGSCRYHCECYRPGRQEQCQRFR